MNKLRNMRGYLGGAMENAPGTGVDWRVEWKQHDWGVVWLDPCDKPIDIGIEDVENHERRKELKKNSNFDIVAKEMRLIRCVDLRMVDISDFLIFNIDVDIHTCGTYEEITTANRQKKPIICRIKQGKAGTPDWLLGVIPHKMIFSNWLGVESYLHGINNGHDARTFNRWMFFDFHGDTLRDRLLDCINKGGILRDIERIIEGEKERLASDIKLILADSDGNKLRKIWELL